MNGESETLNGFRNEYAWLSNFFTSPTIVPVNGITLRWKTGEHLYQAYKLTCLKEGENLTELLYNIAACETPGQAKRMGRKLPIDSKQWDTVALHYMKETIHNKYEQNLELKQKLKDTNSLTLIEYNTWGDTYWGVDSATGKGQNNLGLLLMEYRNTL